MASSSNFMDINSKLKISVFRNGRKVIICRDRPDGVQRRVSVPVRILRDLHDKKDTLESGIKVTFGDNWEVKLTDFAESEYLQFNFLDDSGNRIG